MPGLPAVERLTKKQVRAFRRAEKRRGQKPLKIDVCRIVSRSAGGKVEICRDRLGYYMPSSPGKRKRLQRVWSR
jgi:hypothetical protein